MGAHGRPARFTRVSIIGAGACVVVALVAVLGRHDERRRIADPSGTTEGSRSMAHD
jgi:hypothetical protein